jgi:hypothetical protein
MIRRSLDFDPTTSIALGNAMHGQKFIAVTS